MLLLLPSLLTELLSSSMQPAVQGLGTPVVVTLLSSLAYVALVGWLILRLARRGTGSPLHPFALAAGAYGLYILGSPVAPAWVFLATWHADHVSPQVVFGIGTALCLYWLWRRIRRAQPDTPVSSREL
jgi:hypothetical protein